MYLCAPNTTVKMIKEDNHISLCQGFNQAETRGCSSSEAGEAARECTVSLYAIVGLALGSHDKLTALPRTR